MMRISLAQPYSFCQLGRRAKQEDARFPDSDLPDGRVFVVCDGVGGLASGELASHTVAEAFGRYMAKVDLTEPFTHEAFGRALDYAYRSLDRVAAGRDVATTLTFVCVHGGGVMVAHIGDSRIYHIRPGVGVLYRSSDHSLVNALVHSGNLTPEEAVGHPKSNIIMRCMRSGLPTGSRNAATVVQLTDVAAGDCFLLCTDGVLMDESLWLNEKSGRHDMADLERMNALADRSFDSHDNNTAMLIPILRVEVNEDFMVDEPDIVNDVDTDVQGADDVATTPLAMDAGPKAIDVRPEGRSVFTTIVDFFKSR